MNFYSTDFDNNSIMPAKFTADGLNVCPNFIVDNVPEGTQSLAVVCHDPDATRGMPWIHWLVWNIPPTLKTITESSLPVNLVNGVTSFGVPGYGGPSPSPGTGPHRYVFSLYALSSSDVDLSGKTTLDEITGALEPYKVAVSSWTGIYERK